LRPVLTTLLAAAGPKGPSLRAVRADAASYIGTHLALRPVLVFGVGSVPIRWVRCPRACPRKKHHTLGIARRGRALPVPRKRGTPTPHVLARRVASRGFARASARPILMW